MASLAEIQKLAAAGNKYDQRALAKMTGKQTPAKTSTPAKAAVPKTPTPVSSFASSLKQAQKLAAPIGAAAEQQTQANIALNDTEFQNLVSNINKQLGQSVQGLQTDLSSRGFLRSGEQIGTETELQNTANQNIATADAQRAVSNADQLLQDSNYQQTLAMGTIGEASTLGQALQSESLASQTQALQNLGFPVTQYSNVAQLYQGFLSAGQQIPQWIYDGLQGAFQNID